MEQQTLDSIEQLLEEKSLWDPKELIEAIKETIEADGF